jgi:hypothetical protein
MTITLELKQAIGQVVLVMPPPPSRKLEQHGAVSGLTYG